VNIRGYSGKPGGNEISLGEVEKLERDIDLFGAG
jgi:hypothetical protein